MKSINVDRNKIFKVKNLTIILIKIIIFFYSTFDLYTKSEHIPDIEALWPYYESLIDKYIPGVLEW